MLLKVNFCVQKTLMQTDGWPEMDEGKQPDLINGQDLEQAKAVILNWIKDLRAQPEVGSLSMRLTPSCCTGLSK